MHTDPTPYAGLLDALKDDRGMPLADAVKAFGQDLVDDALNDDVVIVEWDALWACNVVKAPALPEYPCDICGQAVVEGELFTVSDGGLTVEHAACVAQWFRGNFGREGLA